MKRSLRKLISLGILGLLAAVPPLFAQDDARAIAIRWTPVARATGYQIQVRNEGGDITHDRRLRTTAFEPRLEPGTYYYRIAALGKGGKPGKFSPWLQVNVKPTRTPQIGSIQPAEDTPRGKRIEIKGEGFQLESKAFLIRPAGGRVELPTELANENLLYAYVSAALLADGDYDIVVENPRGLNESREEAIQIESGQVKVDRSAQRGSRRISADEVVPPPEPGQKLEALWRSALVPGWGQYHQGRPLLAMGTLGLQAGMLHSYNRRVKQASRAGTLQRTRLTQAVGIQHQTGKHQRNDLYFWARLGEARRAQFDATFAEVQANTAGSAAAGLYLWNAMDVMLYAGQGESAVGESGALWRSLVLPGWGQYASGRPLAGALFSGAFVTVGMAGGAHALGVNEMRQLSAHNNFVRAWSAHYLTGRIDSERGDPILIGFHEAVIERRRITALKHDRDAAGALMGAIYLANVADLYIPWGALGGFGGGGGSAGLYIGPGGDDGLAFGLTFQY